MPVSDQDQADLRVPDLRIAPDKGIVTRSTVDARSRVMHLTLSRAGTARGRRGNYCIRRRQDEGGLEHGKTPGKVKARRETGAPVEANVELGRVEVGEKLSDVGGFCNFPFPFFLFSLVPCGPCTKRFLSPASV